MDATAADFISPGSEKRDHGMERTMTPSEAMAALFDDIGELSARQAVLAGETVTDTASDAAVAGEGEDPREPTGSRTDSPSVLAGWSPHCCRPAKGDPTGIQGRRHRQGTRTTTGTRSGRRHRRDRLGDEEPGPGGSPVGEIHRRRRRIDGQRQGSLLRIHNRRPANPAATNQGSRWCLRFPAWKRRHRRPPSQAGHPLSSSRARYRDKPRNQLEPADHVGCAIRQTARMATQTG